MQPAERNSFRWKNRRNKKGIRHGLMRSASGFVRNGCLNIGFQGYQIQEDKRMGLNIQSSYDDKMQTWNIFLDGEVDVSSASQLRGALDGAFAEEKRDIVLHLEDLRYIDSTGLGVIIGAFGRMQEAGNRIRVVNPREHVQKLLRITCLDQILCSAS